MKKIIASFLVLFAAIAGAGAQNVLNYHPLAKGLALGRSFDLFNPSVAYATDLFSSRAITRSGPESQQVYMSVIDSHESYQKTMRYDASLDASFLSLFSADATYSSEERSLYSYNSLSVCIIGEADYGDFKVSSPVLSQTARDLAGDVVAFKQRFGEFYVSSVHKKQLLYVFVTLHNLSESSRNQISAELGGGANFAVFSASLQGSLNKIVQQFKNSNSVQLTVRSFGRNTLSTLPLGDITNDFFADGKFSTNTYNAVMRYIGTNFRADNASEVEYSYSPLSQFGYRGDDYYNKIGRKFQKYISLSEELKMYNQLLIAAKQATTARGYSLRTTEDQFYLGMVTGKINSRIDKIYDALSDCRQSACESLSNCCQIDEVASPVDEVKLATVRNRYLAPLDELSSFQGAVANRIDLVSGGIGAPPAAMLFEKRGSAYRKLNVSATNPNTYTVQASVAFMNELPYRASYTVTVFVNGYPMGSTGLWAEANSPVFYNYNSEPFKVGTLFLNALPEHAFVMVALTSPWQSGGTPFVTLLPYSRLVFNF